MNRDEIEGKVDKLKGKAKQTIGRATDDPDMVDEGIADETSGDVQEGFGKARRKVGETIEDIGDKIKE
jgi:uncharacterized protein YjbJ (UPF0337 family)